MSALTIINGDTSCNGILLDIIEDKNAVVGKIRADRKIVKRLGHPQRTFANEMKHFLDKYRHLLDD